MADTEVYPRLNELEEIIKNPAKHWYNKGVEIAKVFPELALNLATMPAHLALAKFLSKIAGVLAEARDEQLSTKEKIAKTGLYYLLKLQENAGR